jgi:hypothetical protein
MDGEPWVALDTRIEGALCRSLVFCRVAVMVIYSSICSALPEFFRINLSGAMKAKSDHRVAPIRYKTIGSVISIAMEVTARAEDASDSYILFLAASRIPMGPWYVADRFTCG